MTLGGSLFVHDAIRLDYCVEAAIESLVPLCDRVVAMDCQSTDGTLDLLHAIADRHPNVQVVPNSPWEVADHYIRLAMLANAAREQLKTRWHFMIQADEVLHECSYGAIREMVAADGHGKLAFRVRRFNLWGTPDHYVRLDSLHKPCSDEPTRLGRQDVPAIGDGESLIENRGAARELIEHVTLFHYGFVRHGHVLIDKVIEMESWFHGPHGTPDARVVAMREAGTGFAPAEIIPEQDLLPIPIAHPKAAEAWLASHRNGDGFRR